MNQGVHGELRERGDDEARQAVGGTSGVRGTHRSGAGIDRDGGEPASATPAVREFGLPATVFNPALIETDAHVSSPLDGAIVLWNVADAEGAFSLRVMRPVGATGITYSGGRCERRRRLPGSRPAHVLHRAADQGRRHRRPQRLRSLEDRLRENGSQRHDRDLIPPIDEGRPDGFDQASTGYEFAFNAEIQPRPTVTALSPVSGSFKGGAAARIAGTDFADVYFGPTPAAGYTVNSQDEITAIAPPGEVRGDERLRDDDRRHQPAQPRQPLQVRRLPGTRTACS